MGPSFFHDAEGQDDSENDDDGNETAPSGDESQDSDRDKQHNDSDIDSVVSAIATGHTIQATPTRLTTLIDGG
jgi:hypothetical protein